MMARKPRALNTATELMEEPTNPIASRLFRIGAITSFIQLLIITAYIPVVAFLGPRITGAEAFFIAQETNFWSSLLRLDLMMMFLVGSYLGNFPALLLALYRNSPITTSFAFGFTVIAVILSFAGESTFAMLHLGKHYIVAASEVERSQVIAAGEAVLAQGWWNSTGSYVTGALLQLGGVMISLVMLKSGHFTNVTAIAGIMGNSFDLTQHLLSPFAPDLVQYFAIGMLGYLVWYPMMGMDLMRLSKASKQANLNSLNPGIIGHDHSHLE